jgi:PA14 domain/Bacterial pre-peptidase C-terminal domain/Lipase
MPAPDNAGNNLLLARNIGIPGSSLNLYQDSVGGADRNDYYRFVLPRTQTFSASLTGLGANANFEVLDVWGRRVRGQEGVSQKDGTADESITLSNLGAGIYYIRVYQSSGDTDYTLGVRAENPDAPIPIFPPPIIPPDNAGNSRLFARNIGILGANNQAFRDWVGWADNNDYYRFVTTGTTNLRVSLDGLTADADIEVQNSRGTVIRRSTRGGNSPESINLDGLGAGIYYIRVFPYQNASTDYTLNVKANSAPLNAWSAEYFNNTSLSGAPVLTRIENSLDHNWLSDAPANGVNSDYFSTRWVGRFNFEGGDYRFNIRTDDGMRIWIDDRLVFNSWIPQPPTDYQVLTNLTPGVHQIRVEYYERTERAVAQVSWDRLAPPDYAGNSLTAARDIGVLADAQSYRYGDWVGDADTNDYYRFTVPIGARSNFRVNLTGLSADADVDLLDSRGQVIDFSRASLNRQEYFSQILNEGTYYVRVSQYRGNTSYNLELSRVQLTGIIPGGSSPVQIWQYDGNGRTAQGIDANRQTIVVIHGRTSPGDLNNRSTLPGAEIESLARLLGSRGLSSGAQILAIDWRDPANDASNPPLTAAGWITPVAKWVSHTFTALGIAANQISLIGHSLGSYVSAEIGRLMSGVDSLIALDPAFPARGDNIIKYDLDSTIPGPQQAKDFRSVATTSTAFVVSDSHNQDAAAGDNDQAGTAHESFVIRFSGDPNANVFDRNARYHMGAVSVFTDILSRNLVIPVYQPNRYDNRGNRSNSQNRLHEGVIFARWNGNSNDLWDISELKYTDAAGQERTTWS